MKTKNNISMKSLFWMLFFFGVTVGQFAQATGPRVSTHLLSQGVPVYALDYPPYVSTEITSGGLDVEIIDTVFQAAEVEASLSTLPLKNMVKYYLTQENAIAVLGHKMSFSEQQKKTLIYIPISVINEKYYYYKPDQNAVLSWQGDLNNLKGLTYGTFKGDKVSAYKEAGIEIKYSKPRKLLKKLKSNKVDFIKLPELSAKWMINKYDAVESENYVPMKTVIAARPSFIIFNKKHPDGERVAELFQRTLTNMVEDGRYQAIVEKYQTEASQAERYINQLQGFRNE